MAETTQDLQDSKEEQKMEDVKDASIEQKEENGEEPVKEESSEDRPDAEDLKVEDSKDPVRNKEENTEEKEDEVEEEEEEEPKVGLLEQPVVLEEGTKRQRKKVERMSFQSLDSERERAEIKPGKGTALKDIPIIEYRLGKVKAEDAKPLHRILFRRVGTAAEVKKNIRKFSGFPFGKGEPEYEKRVQMLKAKTFTKPMISHVCEILDVQRSGNKDEVVERLMEWLLKPEDSGKKVPKKRKGKKGKRGSKGKGKKSSAKTNDSDDDDDDDDDDDSDDEDDSDDSDEDSDSDESEEEEPPKKKKRVTKEKKPAEKKEPAKKTETKKKSTATKKKDVVSDISSDSDDEPIMKSKQKVPPTNDELKEVIKKMLDNANLEEVTMKSVLKEVFEKYPEHDLTDRKEFVKNTVKQIIS